MSLRIRAKTVIKLESESARMDIEMQTGASLVGLIKSLIGLSYEIEELTRLETYISLRKSKLIEQST